MKTYNTMTRGMYIFFNLFWVIVTMSWYRLIFREIEGFSTLQSVIILFCILLVSVTAGIVLTIERRCNFGSLAVNITIPFGIYTFISYGRLISVGMAVAFIAIAILSAAYIFFTVKPIPKNHVRRKLIRRIQLIRSFFGVRTITAVCMGLVLLPMIVNSLFGNPFFNFEEKKLTGEEHTIEDNIELLANLEKGRWETLTSDEKLEIVNIIKDIEVCYLGIPHDISIEVEGINDMIAAYYRDSERAITMDSEYFNRETGREILRVVCHEVYHAYQHRLCDAYDSVDERYKDLIAFGNVDDYKYEFNNYINAEKDFEGYDAQALEQNADAYADDAVGDYFRRINLYLYGGDDE